MNTIENIIFMGTPFFAVPVLQKLIKKGYKPNLIITQPDKKSGRGRKITYSPVKKVGLEFDIPIFQPENINNPTSIKKIKNIEPDLIVVVAYGKFIGKTILNIPKHKCINLHPSLLPKYRGPSPINWALFNGDKFSGNSIIYISSKMDAGDIIYQTKIPILPEDNYGSLKKKLSIKGADDILHTIELIENDTINPKPQNDEAASFSKLITKKMRMINWRDSAENIKNLIRGLAPKPAAFSVLDDQEMKIIQANVWNNSVDKSEFAKISSVIKGEGFLVGTSSKQLLIKKIKPAGKQKMSAFSYSLGNEIEGKKFLNVK